MMKSKYILTALSIFLFAANFLCGCAANGGSEEIVYDLKETKELEHFIETKEKLGQPISESSCTHTSKKKVVAQDRLNGTHYLACMGYPDTCSKAPVAGKHITAFAINAGKKAMYNLKVYHIAQYECVDCHNLYKKEYYLCLDPENKFCNGECRGKEFMKLFK